MRVKSCAIAFSVVSFLMIRPCTAQMTCGSTIISGGDSIGKVYRECGPPTTTSREMDGGNKGKGPNTYYYDQGSGKYIKKLFVQGGYIERIELMEKGK